MPSSLDRARAPPRGQDHQANAHGSDKPINLKIKGDNK